MNERINEFELRANLRSITDKALKNDLRTLLKVIINGQEHTLFMRSDVLPQPHEIFHLYRVRKASIDDNLSVCSLVASRTATEEFKIGVHADGLLNEQGTVDFYTLNSELSREKFGAFTRIRDTGML